MSLRTILFAALPLTMLVACGGDDGGGTTTPEGEHYKYVAKSAFVPTNNNQAREYGLDLNGDSTPDNQLGMVLGTLTTMGIDVQGSLSEAVASGSIILLADFQTANLASSSAAGMQVLLGENPTPAACNTGEEATCTAAGVCTGCQHHLDGAGSFTVKSAQAAAAGKIVNGVFTGGPTNINLQIALGGTEPIDLDLIGARVKASAITDSTIGSIIVGGALTETSLNTQVIPAIAGQLVATIAESCTDLAAPPACGCTAGSTGKTVLDLFDGGDGTAKNCMVSVAEIQGNSLIQSLLAPDVEIDGEAALSLGIKVEAVKATFDNN